MSEEVEPDGYKLMEKTWHSSSERVAVTLIWAVNIRETVWSDSAWNCIFATESGIRVSSYDNIFLWQPAICDKWDKNLLRCVLRAF
jgi:hypothetical protein